MHKVALVAHWDWVLYNFRMPLAERLRARGAEVSFVCPPGQYVARLQAAGFRWLPWQVARRSLNPVREAMAVARLTALYRRERFTAVQHFTIKPILYGSIATWLAGVPVTLNTFMGLGYLFSHSRTAAVLRLLVVPLLRLLLHRPTVRTIVLNPRDKARLVERRLVPPQRALVIRSDGIDVARFAPSANGHARDEAPVALLAGRLLWDKGVGEFVEAARQVRARGVRARFWVAGEPDPGNPRYIPDDTLAAWKQEGVVEFLGHCEDMPALLHQASVAVLPSYDEGVPRFLLEAAAAGLPLVASDIEGCRMLVRPGVNGLLVPCQDVGALTEALTRLLSQTELREQMGRASHALAVDEFSQDRILDQYEALYRALGVLP